jgi:hypothetical protein
MVLPEGYFCIGDGTDGEALEGVGVKVLCQSAFLTG